MDRNIIFMGTPDFAVHCLEKLVIEGYTISLVITQPDKNSGRRKNIQKSAVKIKAEELHLEVFQPLNINLDDSVKKIRAIKPSFIVVAAYGQILCKEILGIPEYYCINVHASLLPKYRGAAPINWAIINGEKKTGISIMKMETGLDTGPVFKTSEVNINKHITSGEMHDLLKVEGADILIKTLDEIVNNNLIPLEQDHENSSYAVMMNKEMSMINWNESAENIHNKIRGLDPWPGAYFAYEGKKYKVFNTNYCDENFTGRPGIIVDVDEKIVISTKKGSLIIKEIQASGKKRMTVKNFLLGNKIEKGYKL